MVLSYRISIFNTTVFWNKFTQLYKGFGMLIKYPINSEIPRVQITTQIAKN